LYVGFILVYDVLTTSQFRKSVHGVLGSYYVYLCVFTCFSWVCVFDGGISLAVKIIGSGLESRKNEEVSNNDESLERKELNCSNL